MQPEVSTSVPQQNQWVDPLVDYIHNYAPVPDKHWQEGAVSGINQYLNQLSPGDLLKYYQNISRAANGNFGQYESKTYGVTNQAHELNYTAYTTLKDMLGREPTSGELTQALPAFQGPNGVLNGRAFVSSLLQQYKGNPSLDPGSQQNNQNPKDIGSSVTQQFQTVLGRAPTSDELQHFTQAIQSNQTDAYGLGNFLKQMPEYTNAKDTEFRQGLNTELQNYDVNEFNREKGDIISDYAQRGMSPGRSPSLDYALTDLMGKIAQNRSAYLAQLSASQYGGNKDLAIGNYQNSLNQMYNNNQTNRQNQSAYTQQLLNQGFQGADYQTQMNDYMRFLSNQPKQKSVNPLYAIGGGLVGAGIGGYIGGPAGAKTGYQIGSNAGGAYGYLDAQS